MSKQIIGSIVILVGLGLATFFAYQAFFPPGDLQTTAADPAAEQQAAVQPATESPPEPGSPPADSAGATDPVTPPAPEAAPGKAPTTEAASATEPAPASSDPVALAAKAPMAGAPVPKAPMAGAPAAGAQVPEAQAAEPETASLGPLEPREEHGLLAGRYRGFTSAKKRMEKIKAQDLPAFVRSKGRFYEVWAGPFATTEEAQQARKSLNAVKISAKMGKLTIPVPK